MIITIHDSCLFVHMNARRISGPVGFLDVHDLQGSDKEPVLRTVSWLMFLPPMRVEIFASLVHWFISEASRFASIHCGQPLTPTPSGPSEVVPTKEAVPTVEHATRKPMSASVALENGKEKQSSEHLDVWYAQGGAVW